MNNGITARQLETPNLEKLAAQRMLYSRAKNIMALQVCLGIPVIILLSVLVIVFNNPKIFTFIGDKPKDFSILLTTCGLLFTIIDVISLNPQIIRLKERASKIQESFDCNVLAIQWNDIKIGSPPDNEEIIKYANKYKKNDANFDKIKNWYSLSVESLPLSVARIICQRSNCWWDMSLRKKFIKVVIATASFLFIFLFLLGLIGDLTMKKFLSNVIIPFLPAFVFAMRQIQDNNKAIDNLKCLKQKAEDVWRNFITTNQNDNGEIENMARQFQDELFVNRKDNPLIFDWMYKITRNFQEEQMNYSVEQMIQEYSS